MPRLVTLLSICLVALLACSAPQEPTVNLFRAVELGDLDQVERHLYWDTDLEETDAAGDRPLHIAAQQGRIAIARALVRHGADLSARDGDGHTPLEVALIRGRTQLAEMLIDEGAPLAAQDMLFRLVREGVSDRDSLAFLVERGADLDARDADGLAPIHRAVADGRLELTTRLIRAGIDINRHDEAGRTPLAIALTNGDRDIIALLRQFGAQTTGQPPLTDQPTEATTEIANDR
ncbi:ankyrin repeat domain-containing protein [Thiococcus pfennigii]|jgi:ankyrin repeat protein|uniref:ankyrin repeat domain-containing protein n=1 Tax=Thiococcus pfennigii TaxID=1057 RepID=UPI001902EFB0|nr:ankyrin repeat domain-containing protein [Thiococcus pfennigii]MBK1700701.1 hypothetical protein [Thiococcus pfennigii]MBK1730351.1 hypothetical protein [Thiococcus pfennigii]